ncbi:MAG TPA: response regulator [Chthonomonadaceae bacterium]|nr:response regulator [Chthonomonadaceae bacterium]
MEQRILIIEDNTSNLELMIYLLQAFGYTLLTARSGEEGLEILRREELQLVLCDISMVGMDGYEVARHLKADPSLRTLPLVAVTALAMLGDCEHILATGFDGYIAKPIEPETFVAQMQGFLGATAPPPVHVHDFQTPGEDEPGMADAGS